METKDQLTEHNEEMYTDFEIEYLILSQSTEYLEFLPPGGEIWTFDDKFGMTVCLFEDF